ncbi:protein of unknown function [Candidatus Hydrogenisulfobacillus filiaventi]|uniref:Uncharacterized protein n=1 Tax=Candidatus Hydrogenisulfobacillus filiaventi TaxID=2707344 RepID=A0A6F8ZF20_9FIRM|nr:protein of unknown function [Candidatus Hydrogenisulfobacillus filiaventi]
MGWLWAGMLEGVAGIVVGVVLWTALPTNVQPVGLVAALAGVVAMLATLAWGRPEPREAGEEPAPEPGPAGEPLVPPRVALAAAGSEWPELPDGAWTVPAADVDGASIMGREQAIARARWQARAADWRDRARRVDPGDPRGAAEVRILTQGFGALAQGKAPEPAVRQAAGLSPEEAAAWRAELDDEAARLEEEWRRVTSARASAAGAAEAWRAWRRARELADRLEEITLIRTALETAAPVGPARPEEGKA